MLFPILAGGRLVHGESKTPSPTSGAQEVTFRYFTAELDLVFIPRSRFDSIKPESSRMAGARHTCDSKGQVEFLSRADVILGMTNPSQRVDCLSSEE